MRYIMWIISLLTAGHSYAQELTTAEIKKLGIKKISIFSKEVETGSDNIMVTYYDAYGNDTATYNEKGKVSYRAITYNKKNQPAKIDDYDKDGNLKVETSFKYKPDGSYTTEEIDTDFKLKSVSRFDKKGKQLERTVPDGSVIKYVYNSSGQLTRVYSVPANGGVKINRLYTYNAKGKLAMLKTTGDYPSSVKYEYDAKGLLKKESGSFINTYEYGY